MSFTLPKLGVSLALKEMPQEIWEALLRAIENRIVLFQMACIDR